MAGSSAVVGSVGFNGRIRTTAATSAAMNCADEKVITRREWSLGFGSSERDLAAAQRDHPPRHENPLIGVHAQAKAARPSDVVALLDVERDRQRRRLRDQPTAEIRACGAG